MKTVPPPVRPHQALITGYASQSQGTTFLEGVYKDILSGKDDRLFLKRAKDVLTGEK
ncbi:hypothetical protein, partial [Streptomyces sp. WAC 06725]|uniref:hypothetical protein n=1 Tax=Streptomyces sp. WAC 06725 TaxID=2203209 RepID=UPI00163C0316